jgi:hypothetical protein
MITTYSNRDVDIFNFTADAIDPLDIAHGLSLICRYCGQCRRFYSVAEHSIILSQIVAPQYRKQALLHDASEAYIGDFPGPFKKHFPLLKQVEDKILATVMEYFDVAWDYEVAAMIHHWDTILRWSEMDQMMPRNYGEVQAAVEFGYWDSETAQSLFLQELNQ